jgi:hypothetical protein
LLDEGKLPHCVDLCATGGLRFGDREDFLAEIAQAETMLPEVGTKPQVYYLNRPHLFIAGEIWDPVSDENIEGAVITLTLPDGTKKLAISDDFGDFWFRRIDAGDYSLTIEAKGFKSFTKQIVLTKSINLGDFALERAS